MVYPVNHPPVVEQKLETKPKRSKIIIAIAIGLGFIVAIVIVGVGLGVGLGIGLRKKTNDNTPSSGENTNPSAPIVTCLYENNSSACGCAPTKPRFLSSRIVNGYSAVPHSWPWTIALYDDNIFMCQGFLITYEYVVTAAHCVSDRTGTTLQVYAGVHLRSSASGRQIRDVVQIISHPEYTPDFLNDIAILKLNTPLIPTSTVGLCCLSFDSRLPTKNEAAVIVGWGRLRDGDGSSLPDALQQTTVQIQACKPPSNSTGQFCAGYNNNDACQGDSGGPLMTNVNNAWTCTGIVSYGYGCGNGGYYTRVSNYRSFIDNTIRFSQ